MTHGEGGNIACVQFLYFKILSKLFSNKLPVTIPSGTLVTKVSGERLLLRHQAVFGVVRLHYNTFKCCPYRPLSDASVGFVADVDIRM